MYEFFTNNPLFIVMLIAVICWLGILIYVWQLGRQVSGLDRVLSEEKE
jgi:CcmD family protein